MTDGTMARLRERLATVDDLERARAVLDWDQQTQMPPGGTAARAEQLGTLTRLAHEIFTAGETGELLAEAEEEVAGLPADNLDAALVRVARREYDLATRVPASLMAAIRRHAGLAHPVWVEARATNNYAPFAPYLEQTIAFSRELADYLGPEEERYDALLGRYEPGMRAAQVRQIFAELKAELVPLVAAIAASDAQVDDAIFRQAFEEGRQEAFGVEIVRHYGYDFRRGRQDRTIHPFETAFSRDDVRITTRFNPNFLTDSLFSTLHESGHGMYEQGIAPELQRSVLSRGASLSVHESQSRLWENVVGRSRAFWNRYFPLLQETFPEQLGSADAEAVYRAVNKVQPSFIRVDADEVTYNLHIMLRFEMELDLLEGRVGVEEAPEIWNQKMEEYLGVRPPSDTLGILQDTHWSSGLFGYFPTYSLGNILSVQLYEAALADHPSIPSEIGEGRFETLRGWLTDHVYRYGRIFEPGDLIVQATGQPLTIEPYVSYLKSKFGELYRL